MPSATSTELRLGFLTAIEVPERGHVAGFLVTNRYSRPLEFQCTTPVKPNRTQELLYGPTLTPFLLGELLARPLVEKVNVKPDLIITDRPEMLQVREQTGIPIACLAESSSPIRDSATRVDASDVSGSCDVSARADSAGDGGNSQVQPQEQGTVRCGSPIFRVHPAHSEDGAVFSRLRETLPQQVDLAEPLGRVREALKEALSSVAGASR